MRTVVILAFRGSAGAKTRLSSLFTEAERAHIAWAMLDHVLNILGQSRMVDHLLVVTREPDDVQRRIVNGPDLSILVQPPEYDGLNAAFDLGREWAAAQGYDQVLILHPDLPLLGIPDVQCMTRSDASVSIAVDVHGHGTNALLLRLDTCTTHHFAFAFGPGSYERHIIEAKRLGLRYETLQTNGLSHDLDVPGDWKSLPEDVQARLTGQPSREHSRS